MRLVNKNIKINVCIVTLISFAFIVIGSVVLNYSMGMVRKNDDNRVEKITLAEKRNIDIKGGNKGSKKNVVTYSSDMDKTNRSYNSVNNLETANKSNITKKDNKSSDVKVENSVKDENKGTDGSFNETEKSEAEEVEILVSPKTNSKEKNNKTTASPENIISNNSEEAEGKSLFYEGETNKIEYKDGKDVWNVSMVISSTEGDIRGPEDLKETEAFGIALNKIKESYGTDFKTKEVTMYFSDKGLGSNIRYYYGYIGSESDKEKYMFEVNSTTGNLMSVEKY